MIKVTVKKKDNYIVDLKISGHANSDEYGKDLVCAGVSTASIGTLNMLVKKDFLNRNLGTIVNQVDDICQVVLETLVVILETMVESYSQYIKISIMEV